MLPYPPLSMLWNLIAHFLHAGHGWGRKLSSSEREWITCFSGLANTCGTGSKDNTKAFSLIIWTLKMVLTISVCSLFSHRLHAFTHTTKIVHRAWALHTTNADAPDVMMPHGGQWHRNTLHTFPSDKNHCPNLAASWESNILVGSCMILVRKKHQWEKVRKTKET